MAGRGSTGSSHTNHRAVAYLRRSTDRQEQSIPDQKKAAETYAQQHGFQLVDYYVDDAISGTTTLGRKAFQEHRPVLDLPVTRVTRVLIFWALLLYPLKGAMLSDLTAVQHSGARAGQTTFPFQPWSREET